MIVTTPFRKLARSVLSRTGLEVVSAEDLASLRSIQELASGYESQLSRSLLQTHKWLAQARAVWRERYGDVACFGSMSQLGQDVFALTQSRCRTGGFFVEFGATNGWELSNTFLLEKLFGWLGIVAEPARQFHAELARTRRCAIDHRAVWSRTGETLQFLESTTGALSSLLEYAASDHHEAKRRIGQTYPVETVSLNELLDAHGAPREIDYISIDTEGSELAILEAFDFDRFEVRCLTIEHNYTENRSRIQSLLKARGYEHVHQGISLWDDWFVHPRASGE